MMDALLVGSLLYAAAVATHSGLVLLGMASDSVEVPMNGIEGVLAFAAVLGIALAMIGAAITVVDVVMWLVKWVMA